MNKTEMTEHDIHGLFELLDRLALLDSESLKNAYCHENREALRRLALELNDEITVPDATSAGKFRAIITELCRMKTILSRSLGGAIVLASRRRIEGSAKNAVSVLEEYIRMCPSRFYREIASMQKNMYESEVRS